MLKNISSLGKVMNKIEQQQTHGGVVGCKVIIACPPGLVFSCNYCSCVFPDPA